MDTAELRAAVREAADRLAAAGVASPQVDARLLAEHLLGRPLLLADGAPADFLTAYRRLVERRAAREPLQHVIGLMWFRGLELVSRPGVFIVRPETEVVAGAAIEAARGLGATAGQRLPVVVDLCTGSAAIAAAVAAEVPGVRVLAVEFDQAAATLAEDNCTRLVPGRVEVLGADATDPATLRDLDGQVDVVVSNPPYVPVGAVEDLETTHDPALALYGGGAAGLEVPCAVVSRASALLRTGGTLVMEHDVGQGAALRRAARAAGFADAATGRDLTGRDRFLLARR
ncbi:MAG: HemK/PrmC family methyltransferase [Actinomyces sp.]|uniref:N5-glutamine methyltransferase family protein n=1 Tax=Actinomyces sp. TaxID=29317 RepID=UPI0026DBA261|nr:HemK/PrmC family methyltransferase [Actinomyces sp.]MDO4242338.1 HemK/PrmC family methyltransferase [Actinomyces sp.]